MNTHCLSCSAAPLNFMPFYEDFCPTPLCDTRRGTYPGGQGGCFEACTNTSLKQITLLPLKQITLSISTSWCPRSWCHLSRQWLCSSLSPPHKTLRGYKEMLDVIVLWESSCCTNQDIIKCNSSSVSLKQLLEKLVNESHPHASIGALSLWFSLTFPTVSSIRRALKKTCSFFLHRVSKSCGS